jgi:hypothetical protein
VAVVGFAIVIEQTSRNAPLTKVQHVKGLLLPTSASSLWELSDVACVREEKNVLSSVKHGRRKQEGASDLAGRHELGERMLRHLLVFDGFIDSFLPFINKISLRMISLG